MRAQAPAHERRAARSDEAMAMKHNTVPLQLAAAIALLCGNPFPANATAGTAAKPCPTTGARVLVTAMGIVTVNGKVVPVDSLAAALNGLAPRPTEVCYFREKPKGEAPAAVKIAVNAIISTHLPISFYSEASFAHRAEMPVH
jgi:hypothetical protein